MPRPQPIIVEQGAFNPTSPRYRYQPLPLRVAVRQLEKLTVQFGEDVLDGMRDKIDITKFNAAEQYQADLIAWSDAIKLDPKTAKPKPRVDLDMIGSMLSLARGLYNALTGSTLVTIQTEHLLASEVEVEVVIDGVGRWIRLVQLAAPVPGVTGVSSELDCSGFDYDLPAEDLLPLWWLLLEVNILPLFRAARAAMKRMFGERSKADDSQTLSPEPADTDSLVV